MGAIGLLILLAGLALLAGGLAGQGDEIGQELGSAWFLVAAVLLGVGAIGLLAGWGIWRRKRWAWMLTLVLQGFNVLQLIMAVASGGFEGIVSFGLIPAVAALLIFYYLSRPHVVAAFGRSRPAV